MFHLETVLELSTILSSSFAGAYTDYFFTPCRGAAFAITVVTVLLSIAIFPLPISLGEHVGINSISFIPETTLEYWLRTWDSPIPDNPLFISLL